MTIPDGRDVVEIGARAAYHENDWWRSLAPDDDGKGRYRDCSGVTMRAVEWEELDDADRASRLREMQAALTAIESSGRWKIVPVDDMRDFFAEIEARITSIQGELRHYKQPQDVHFHLALKACRDGVSALSASPKVTP